MQVSTQMQSACLILLLALVLALTASDFGGEVPPLPEYEPRTGPDAHLTPVDQLPGLFTLSNWVALVPLTNSNPFFTTHSQPPPAKKAETTKQVEIVFQGVYQTGTGERLAFIRIGESLVTVPAGTSLQDKLTLSEVGFDAIVITDPSGKTHRIEFNTKKMFELPP